MNLAKRLLLLVLLFCLLRGKEIEQGKLGIFSLAYSKSDTFSYALDATGQSKEILVNIYTIVGDFTLEVSSKENLGDPRILFAGAKREISFSIQSSAQESTHVSFQLKINANPYCVFGISVITKESEKDLSYPIALNHVLQEQLSKDNQKKIFVVPHSEKEKEITIVNSFQALNCEVEVKYGETVLESEDGLVSHEINKDNADYQKDSFTYEVTLKSIYNNKEYSTETCLFSILSYEVTDTANIALSEGFPTKLKLDYNERKKVTVAYHINDSKKAFFSLFKIQENNLVSVKPIICEASNYQPFYFRIEGQIGLSSQVLPQFCRSETDVDTIKMEIEFLPDEAEQNKNIYVNIEITAYQEYHFPIPITKNKAQRYLGGDGKIQYFFTDLPAEEVAEVQIDSAHGGMNAFAKLVSKDTTSETGSNWGGIVKLPDESDADLLNYSQSYQTVYITKEASTNLCAKGCFLVIGLISLNKNQELGDTTDFIITYKNLLSANSIVEIPLNHLITGKIKHQQTTDTPTPNVYTFTPTIQGATSYVLEVSSKQQIIIYGKDGTEIPTKDLKDFEFVVQGENSVLSFSTKGSQYTLSFSYNKAQEYKLSMISYTFKVREVSESKKNIIEGNVNEYSLCEVKEADGFCDFLFKGKPFEDISNVYIYGTSYWYVKDTNSSYLEMYVKDVKTENFNKLKVDDESLLPTKSSHELSSSSNLLKNTIVKGNFNSGVESFIRVYSTKPTVLQLMPTRYFWRLENIQIDSMKETLVYIQSNSTITLTFPKEVEYYTIFISKVEGDFGIHYVTPEGTSNSFEINNEENSVLFTSRIVEIDKYSVSIKTKELNNAAFTVLFTPRNSKIEEETFFLEPDKNFKMFDNTFSKDYLFSIPTNQIKSTLTLTIKGLSGSSISSLKLSLDKEYTSVYDSFLKVFRLSIPSEAASSLADKRYAFITATLEKQGNQNFEVSLTSEEPSKQSITPGVFYSNDLKESTKGYNSYLISKQASTDTFARIALYTTSSEISYAVVDYNKGNPVIFTNSSRINITGSYSNEKKIIVFKFPKDNNEFYLNIFTKNQKKLLRSLASEDSLFYYFKYDLNNKNLGHDFGEAQIQFSNAVEDQIPIKIIFTSQEVIDNSLTVSVRVFAPNSEGAKYISNGKNSEFKNYEVEKASAKSSIEVNVPKEVLTEESIVSVVGMFNNDKEYYLFSPVVYQNEKKGLSTGKKVMFVILGIILLIIIVGFIWHVIRRKNIKDTINETKSTDLMKN